MIGESRTGGALARPWIVPSRAADAPRRASAGPLAPADVPRMAGTLGRAFTLSGRGLHCGRRSRVRVAPRPDGGIVFRRGDVEVAGTWQHRERQVLANAVRLPDGRPIRLIEHLLAALAAYGIDHAAIEVEGEELPILDGSALPWCRAIAAAGRVATGESRIALEVLEPVEVRCGSQHVRIEPAPVFSLDVRIAMRGLGPMHWTGAVTPDRFVAELAPSRSFGRLCWAVPALLWGLAHNRPVLRGAWPGTTAIVWGDRVLGGMRVPQEPVRHRVLDLVGDLALAGRPILGHVAATNPGHDINSHLLETLMRRERAWRLVPL